MMEADGEINLFFIVDTRTHTHNYASAKAEEISVIT